MVSLLNPLLAYIHTFRSGSVFRINPNELHLSNPQVYFAIYSPQVKFFKDSNFYFCFAQDESSFGCTDHSITEKGRVLSFPLSPIDPSTRRYYPIQG
ncbi:hypothetical protein DFS33DRAFT_526871 [Desarmillaria ectypa]|nr:hypothetical protein DFS33DRAFT_526871 [Desarmillaria ectypa]